MISIIVAIAENNAIGKNNDLLWHIPEDMKRFRKITSGHKIIMGKRTYESLPYRPLKNRTNIVISDIPGDHYEGCVMAYSIQEAMDHCSPDEECFIIGGGMVYRQFLPLADKLYITRVDKSFDADIFFPDIDKGFAELKRVLKSGGRCAVVCWDHPETFDMMKLLKQSIATAVPDFEMPTQTPVWARMVGEQALEEKFQQAGFSKVDVCTIDGLLTLDSVEDFWSVFIASSPPMISLFAALGKEDTERAGEVFVRLATDDYEKQIVTLASKACVGIASV